MKMAALVLATTTGELARLMGCLGMYGLLDAASAAETTELDRGEAIALCSSSLMALWKTTGEEC